MHLRTSMVTSSLVSLSASSPAQDRDGGGLSDFHERPHRSG